MSPADIVILLLAFAAVAGAIVHRIVRRKNAKNGKGGDGCCGGCSGCTGCAACSSSVPPSGEKDDQSESPASVKRKNSAGGR